MVKKIKKNLGGMPRLMILVLALLVLIFGASLSKNNQKPQDLEVKKSAFKASLDQEQKETEEKKKAEEEKKRQEEETKKFITNFGPCRYLPILTYHHIGSGTNPLFVKSEIFDAQMDYLKKKGYTAVTLKEVVENLQSGQVLPNKPVVLTFDDGYRDFYGNALPILSKYSLRATLFVITQLVGGDDYVTWDQLRVIVSSGLVTIGDHTLSHVSLPSVEEPEARNQILSAKSILETNLGVTVDTFAYPYGGVSEEAEKVLAEGEFVAAVTTKRGLSCAKLPYELPRVRIGNAPLSSYGL